MTATETPVPAHVAELQRVGARVRRRQGAKAAEPQTAPRDGDPLRRLRAETARLDPRLPDLIVGAYKNGGQGADHGLVLTDGSEINLGDIDRLHSPRIACRRIAEATTSTRLTDPIVILPPPSAVQWKPFVAAFLAAVELRDVSITDDEITREWLAGFVEHAYGVQQVTLSDTEQLHELLMAKPQAFTDERGRLYVRLEDFHRYVNRSRGERASARELAQRLGALGFAKHQLAARPPGGGDPVRLRAWQSRGGFDLDA